MCFNQFTEGRGHKAINMTSRNGIKLNIARIKFRIRNLFTHFALASMGFVPRGGVSPNLIYFREGYFLVDLLYGKCLPPEKLKFALEQY